MDVPLVVGQSGLTGRPQLRPDYGDLEPDEEGAPVPMGQGMPPPCLHALYSPRGGCHGNCPGVQPDGGCLADVVRAAKAQGVDWSFEVVTDDAGQRWVYTGPPLA